MYANGYKGDTKKEDATDNFCGVSLKGSWLRARYFIFL